MVQPYLRRRQGLEPVSYAHPSLEPVLAETLGVILFQEQVIRVAVAIAGFTPAEADQLRRAISRSRSDQAMVALRERFFAGARANGISEGTANEVFRQLAAFAEFGFCKSHAAAFALVAYQSLYLKAYFAPEFYCALLNHQPMGFYSPEVLLGDAQRHGVPVLHPDINRSQDHCILETIPASNPSPSRSAIRLGLRYVYSLGEVWRARIVERRGERPYRGLPDFCRRVRLPRPVVENLIRSGAMDSLAQKRRDLLWELGGLDYHEEGMDIEVPVEPVALPALGHAERLGWEYELLGLAPGEHVMQLYREQLRKQGSLSSRELQEQQDGQKVRVAGLVVVRQRPATAKGHVFITLEDEEGLVNLIVRPNVYAQYRDVLRNALLLWVEGRLQYQERAMSVLVYKAQALSSVRES